MDKHAICEKAKELSIKANKVYVVCNNEWGEWSYYPENSFHTGEIIAVYKNGVDISD